MKIHSFQVRAGAASVSKETNIDSPQTVMFVFGAPEFLGDSAIFKKLRDAYPKSFMMGCSSAGEIFGNQVFDKTLSVAAAKFENTKLNMVSFPISNARESHGVGKVLAARLKSPDLRGIFILSDGLKINGSELIRGVNEAVGPNVVVTGGLAGDGSRFKQTWVLNNGAASSGCITAIGFYGPKVRIGHGSQGGWDPIGREYQVTSSIGNTLYTLNNEPALDLYKKMLGDKASGLPATGLLFPLQIYNKENPSRKLVRTLLGVDIERKALVFAGDIPEHYQAQFMTANFERLVEGSGNAARLIRGGASGGDHTLALAISCVGRRLVLGERTNEELQATLRVLPKGVHQVGFYSYGEISPYVQGQACELHNQTMTLTTISEAA